MFKSKSPYVSIFAMVFLGFALSALFGIAKPDKAEAAFSCWINTPTRNGEYVTFSVGWSVTNDHEGAPDYTEWKLGSGEYEINGTSKTYKFAYGSQHTVAANVQFIGNETIDIDYNYSPPKEIKIPWKNGAVCGSRTYTMPSYPPTGWADKCTLEGANTVIHGWAYDNDTGANDGRPQTQVNVNGDVKTVDSSVAGYRSGAIEGWLNFIEYGSGPARDGQYGWTATYSGLWRGGTYGISGTVLNVGSGPDAGLGISSGNSLDGVAVNGFPGNVIPADCLPNNPTGWADTCTLDGMNTVIYGWAYDNDTGANDGRPQTQVNVNGDVKTVDSSVAGFRSGAIEGYLNWAGYGSGPARDGQYGWTATYSGLWRGGTYGISGTVLNVGGGSNVGLSINGSNTLDGVAVNSFPGNVLPAACLPVRPPPVPACSVTVAFVDSILPNAQPNDTIRLTITIVNNAPTGGELMVPANYPVTRTLSGIGPRTYNAYNNGAGIPADSGVTHPEIIENVVANFGVGDFNLSVYITKPDGARVDCTGPPVIRVVTYPYTQFFQTDVIAGYGLNSSGLCSASGGNVAGYIDTDRAEPTKIVGSGVQMAIFAAGAVNGFRSAITQDGQSNANPKKKVFANTGLAAGAFAYSPSYGGNFDYPMCATDSWSQDLATTDPTLDSDSNVDINFTNSRKYAGPIRVYSGVAGLKGYRRVMVEGDVLIGSNENQPVYSGTGGWSSVADIPMTIIYATGNVYIASNVTSFDGIVVSEKTIYTCIPSSMDVTQAKTFTDTTTSLTAQTDNYGVGSPCYNSLTINGALVSDKIKLWRTGGTLNISLSTQNYNGALASGAEVFRQSPELFMATRGDETGFNGTGGGAKKLDSLVALPPRY